MVNSNKSQPILSLIVGARNDSYMGDFKWRLGTCLNCLGRSLAAIGRLDDVEMVVCDWGSEVPLHRELALNSQARKIVRFIIVPPETAVPAQKDSQFPIPMVQNVAIRRSRGEYIAQTDSDIIFTPLALERLLAALEGKISLGVNPEKALLTSSRKHIPQELTLAKPNLEELEEYLNQYGAMLPFDKLIPGIGTPSGLAMMHRSLWQSCGGYDERLIYWGWMEIDLYLRITRKYPWRDMANYGAVLYHIEHYPGDARIGPPREMNPMLTPRTFFANDENWGMADDDFEIIPAEETDISEEILAGLKLNSSGWRSEGVKTALKEDPLSILTSIELEKKVLEMFLKVSEMPQGKRLNLNEEIALRNRSLENETDRDWDYMNALTYFAGNFHPLTYLEVGSSRGTGAAVVAGSYRPVAIYGFDAWENSDVPPTWLAELLSGMGHQGYVRHIIGEDASTLSGFFENTDNPQQIDLIFHGSNVACEEALANIRLLLPRLAPGGAFILHHPSEEVFDRVWEKIKSENSGNDFFTGDRTGMLLRIKPEKPFAHTSDESKVTDISDIKSMELSKLRASDNIEVQREPSTKPFNDMDLKIDLYFDLNDGCNLNCKMCDVENNMKTQQVTEFDLFRERVLPIFRAIDDFQFGCRYEPLLIPYYEDAVRLIGSAKRADLRGKSMSNGTLLTDSVIKAMIDSGTFNRLRFSIDAVTRELFESIRRGANFDKLMRKIEKLIQYRNRQKSATTIEFNFTVMRENIHQLPEMVRLAQRMGVECVTTNKLSPDDYNFVEQEYFDILAAKNREAEEIAENLNIEFHGQLYRTQAMYEKELSGKDNDASRKTCGYLTGRKLDLLLDPFGRLTTPCRRIKGELANIQENGFPEILSGRKFRNFLELIRSPEPAVCAECYMFSVDGDKAVEAVKEAPEVEIPRITLTEEKKAELGGGESELDYIIPPEIKDDQLYHLIEQLARNENIKTVLEIGSSSGDGSTEAFVKGLRANPNKPTIYCLEVSKSRFAELRERYNNLPFVKPYNYSSIPVNKFPSEDEIREFYHTTKTALNDYPLDRVLGWLKQDIDYTVGSGVPDGGISRIKLENNINTFDMVLIDGSEFTGGAELDEVYGARIILLDDINGFKNRGNYERLKTDSNYELMEENWNLRNGYAVFRRNDDTLPVHFFTIVLNGEPLIRHHIEEFKRLTFKWRWHIVEGVAELIHDTAWSVPNGGHITDELHRNGLSNDGTTEYIDEIARQYPENITVYRKSPGVFWEGKREMVNAPLKNIREGCLLWQVDSDELWTAEQIEKARRLFRDNPDKHSAYFHCDYFVGPRKYVSSNNTWATYPEDWIRVWRFLPGMEFSSHEPPALTDSNGRNIGKLNPFTRDETRSPGITFQHFAYITEAQVRFKEVYYGYKDAVRHWKELQKSTGLVNPADYLPWAKDDATVEDWNDSNGILLSERLFETEPRRKRVKIAGQDDDGSHDLMAVDTESNFSGVIDELFASIRPKKLIETGTYQGTGTTTIIASALRRLGIQDARFFTIEVNPEHHQQARMNLARENLDVIALLGVSVPRNILPTLEEIELMTVENIEFEDIFVDHQEHDRALFYFQETNFEGVPDDLLGRCLAEFDFRPDFVLLDSAGHMGNIEFKYLIDLLKGECYIALDDVYHIKHHKSMLQMKEDPRFEIVHSSREKFGFCIAKFTPGASEIDSDVENIIWIRTDSIGDNLLSASLLPHIRSKFKAAKIIVFCQEHIAELYQPSPYVDRIISFDKKQAYENEGYRNDVVQTLQTVEADTAFNSVYARETITDFFALNSGAKKTAAFEGNLDNIQKEVRDRNNDLYSKIFPSRGEHKPELERLRDFLSDIGMDAATLQPVIWTTEEDDRFADEFFRENNLHLENTLAIAPAAQWDYKLYDRYAEALKDFAGYDIVILGGKDGFEPGAEICRKFPGGSINLAGKTTIRQTAGIIRKCRLYIGADTAGAHIACAVGTPNVVLLGGGHFGRFLPYSHLTSVVCLPLECYNCNWKCRYQRVHCIRDIEPEVIVEAIKRTLKGTADKPRAFIQNRSGWNPLPGQPEWKPFDEFLQPGAVEIIPLGDTADGSSSILPQSNDVHQLLKQGESLFAEGDLEGAFDAWKSVVETDPNSAEAHNNLGVLHFDRQNLSEAAHHFKTAVEIDPDNQDAVYNYTGVLIAMGRFMEMKSICLTYLQRHPGDSEISEILEKLTYHVQSEPEPVQPEVDKVGTIGDASQENLPMISVVTPSYNQGRFIERTILSVLEQNYPNFEHFVYDGGSNDGTIEILKKYQHLKWISEKDRGQSHALNKGFRQAKGDMIAWINSDDYYEPGIFRAAAEYFRDNPDRNIVMGDCNLVDENGIIFDEVVNVERGFDLLKQYWVGNSIPTQPAVFFRKKLLDEFGYLDESLQYGMDYDLWLRFAQKHWFHHLDMVAANYRFHQKAKNVDQDWSNCLPDWEEVHKRYIDRRKPLPKVSVIIPCYNYARFLPESVGSVIAQSYRDFEIIIVDDGSTDNTDEAAKRLITENPDVTIRLMKQANSGQPAISRNNGIARAFGNYIVCLDADDAMDPNLLTECVKVLDSDPKIAVAYTDQVHVNGSRSKIMESQEWDMNRLPFTNLLPTCSMFRKEVWNKTGGYKTNVRGYEDWDFWIAMGEKGYTGKRIPRPLFYYRVKDDGVYDDALKNDLKLRKQIILNHPDLYTENMIARFSPVGYSEDDLGRIYQSLIDFHGDKLGEKGVEELKFWTRFKLEHGLLGNGHFKPAFTTHFGLDDESYRNKRILDIGCGPQGSLEWADMASERVCLDPLASYYGLLGINEHKAQYITSPSEQIPFPDEYFNVVTSFNSLDHVDDLDKTISEIIRVIASGGLFLLLTDVNHPPTATEPISYSWDIVNKFIPQLKLVNEEHFEKSRLGIYDGVFKNSRYNHNDKTSRGGVLLAKFVKNS